ncbi:aminomethyl-transferring glycine dehydrogenase subunit GcvPB, partial [Candidatus Bipolaricaulota bacterium]|nr:aminomethyl-transferring glycine dehydrogenase subunit GcvPB [Candidatus Bipolaricaulota bacterium]
MSTIFDCRCGDKIGGLFPELDVPSQGVEQLIDPQLVRTRPPRLPDLSEPQVARHYTTLSKLNFGVDDGFYP